MKTTTAPSPSEVDEQLRSLAISIGLYRLTYGTSGTEIDERLATLQNQIAEIADEFTIVTLQDNFTNRCKDYTGELAIKLVDSLVQSEIRSISPEVYHSVRDTGVELLGMLAKPTYKQAA